MSDGGVQSLLELWHQAMLRQNSVGVLAIVVAAPSAMVLCLCLVGLANHVLVEGLPFKHGAGFMVFVLAAMLSGQAYLLVFAASVLA